MKTTPIVALEKKVRREGQKALEKVYAKYNKQMNELLAQATPVGHHLRCGNGMVLLVKNKGGIVLTSGNAWGRSTETGTEDIEFNFISGLQYRNEHRAGFNIKGKIQGAKAKKPVKIKQSL